MSKLKYVIMFLLAIIIFITCSYAVDVRVNFAQINLPTDAVIQNSRTLVPLRILSEIFGAKVHWEESGKVTVYHHDNIIVLNKDSEYININGKTTKTDTKVIEKEDYKNAIEFLRDFYCDPVDKNTEKQIETKLINTIILQAQKLRKEKKFVDAIDALSLALRYDENNKNIFLELAQISQEIKDYNAAKEYMKIAEEL